MSNLRVSHMYRHLLPVVAAFALGLGAISAHADDHRTGSESEGGGAADPLSDTEQYVLERAQRRWERLLEGDIDGAYEYTSPAYRSRTPTARFRAQFGNAIRWTDASTSTARCGHNRCEVSVDVTYTLPRDGISHTRPIRETWIHADDDWWIRMGR